MQLDQFLSVLEQKRLEKTVWLPSMLSVSVLMKQSLKVVEPIHFGCVAYLAQLLLYRAFEIFQVDSNLSQFSTFTIKLLQSLAHSHIC